MHKVRTLIALMLLASLQGMGQVEYEYETEAPSVAGEDTDAPTLATGTDSPTLEDIDVDETEAPATAGNGTDVPTVAGEDDEETDAPSADDEEETEAPSADDEEETGAPTPEGELEETQSPTVSTSTGSPASIVSDTSFSQSTATLSASAFVAVILAIAQ